MQLKQNQTETHPLSIWAEAMRATVSVGRRSLKGEDELLRAVSDELQRLNMTGFILLLMENGLLELEDDPTMILENDNFDEKGNVESYNGSLDMYEALVAEAEKRELVWKDIDLEDVINGSKTPT